MPEAKSSAATVLGGYFAALQEWLHEPQRDQVKLGPYQLSRRLGPAQPA